MIIPMIIITIIMVTSPPERGDLKRGGPREGHAKVITIILIITIIIIINTNITNITTTTTTNNNNDKNNNNNNSLRGFSRVA